MRVKEFVERGAALSQGARVAIIACLLLLVGLVLLLVYVLWWCRATLKSSRVALWLSDRLQSLVLSGGPPAFERFRNEPGPSSADVDDLDSYSEARFLRVPIRVRNRAHVLDSIHFAGARVENLVEMGLLFLSLYYSYIAHP